MEDLLLIGFGGHAKSVIDSILCGNKYHICGALDSEKIGESYCGCEVIGNDECLEKMFQSGVRNAFVAIGFMGKSNLREKIYDRIKRIGFNIPVIIDPSAVIAKDAELGEGTFVGKNAVINSGVVIEKMGIINTGSIIEHECKIGEYSHIAIGAKLSGRVSVDKSVFMGAGSVAVQGLHIGKKAIIGAGTVVIRDVPSGCTLVGNPGKIIKTDNMTK